jgi:hypothetical protein
MEDFQEYREVAKRAIIATGADPVLVEDYPGLTASPRNACLDGVASCDIFIGIIGKRGGWTTPSGKLAVEEEYEEAKRKKLHVLVFLQNISRDREAERLAEKLSDYVGGHFRLSFNSPVDLEAAINRSLPPIIQYFQNPKAEVSMIQDKLRDPYCLQYQTCLRFVSAPERGEECIDPVFLESEELERQIYVIGHSHDVNLFSYKYPKTSEVRATELIIKQSEESGRVRIGEMVHLELNTACMITIDMNITGESNERDDWSGTMAVYEKDLVAGLNKCFAFLKAFFELRDPYKRYDRVYYNTALSGLGYRTLLKEPPKNGTYSTGFGGEEIIITFESPTLISRADLHNPTDQVARNLSLLGRRIKDLRGKAF